MKVPGASHFEFLRKIFVLTHSSLRISLCITHYLFLIKTNNDNKEKNRTKDKITVYLWGSCFVEDQFGVL